MCVWQLHAATTSDERRKSTEEIKEGENTDDGCDIQSKKNKKSKCKIS